MNFDPGGTDFESRVRVQCTGSSAAPSMDAKEARSIRDVGKNCFKNNTGKDACAAVILR
jgi:hypothetical protein